MTNPRYIVYKQHQIPPLHFKIVPIHHRSFERMNKIDLIQTLKDSSHLSRSEAEAVINLFFDKMTYALAQGERVEIRGLCSFSIKKYSGYTGRNPKTGEKVKIAPKKLPFFKVGKELKGRVDG
jgi:integration host factor subunit beta